MNKRLITKTFPTFAEMWDDLTDSVSVCQGIFSYFHGEGALFYRTNSGNFFASKNAAPESILSRIQEVSGENILRINLPEKIDCDDRDLLTRQQAERLLAEGFTFKPVNLSSLGEKDVLEILRSNGEYDQCRFSEYRGRIRYKTSGGLVFGWEKISEGYKCIIMHPSGNFPEGSSLRELFSHWGFEEIDAQDYGV